VTSSGLHGANRLASNSLLEGLVFGTACGRGAAEVALTLPDSFTVPPIQNSLGPSLKGRGDVSAPLSPWGRGAEGEGSADLDVVDITNSLRSLMVRKMGVTRDRSRLEEAQQKVEFWCSYVLARGFAGRAGWELQNLLTVARLMIGSALHREESRGVHFRSDFPQREDVNWLRHISCPPRTSALA
jgi:L-aspartate oxidase